MVKYELLSKWEIPKMAQIASELIKSILLGKKNVRIKLLGDSITHGVGGTGFCQNGEHIVDRFSRNPDGFCWAKLFADLMIEKYGATVVNNACTGTNIQYINRFFDELVEESDDIVICTIGTNNRHQYFKDAPKRTADEMKDIFRENIRILVGKLRDRGIPFIFMANIPASAANEMDGADNWRIIHMNDINDLYKEMADELDFPLVSLYDRFSAYIEENGIELGSLLKDGLHPNDDGYRVMFRLITEALKV